MALRGQRDPSEASEPMLWRAGLDIPQHCIVCPCLEIALGRPEAGQEFNKFLIVWLKCHWYKAQAVVPDDELGAL